MRNAVLGSALAASLAVAAPAMAAGFAVTSGSTFAVPGINDFQGNLGALGLGAYTTVGASISLTGPRKLVFEYMGSESGNVNSFTAGSVGPFAEYNKAAWGPVLIGSDGYAGGPLTSLSFSSIGGVANSLVGQDSFGIFIPNTRTGSYNSNVLYLGFDDQINNVDDNHDDFIIRVTAVPEPASWAMLMAGFGLVGMTARRRAMREVTA